MLRHLLLVGLLCLAALTDSRAAQPDYTNALWASAYPGHWYTTGYAHAFVVVHDMEGYYLSTISYFQQSNTQASAHFCVNGLKDNANDSPAGEITQMVEEQYWAWPDAPPGGGPRLSFKLRRSSAPRLRVGRAP